MDNKNTIPGLPSFQASPTSGIPQSAVGTGSTLNTSTTSVGSSLPPTPPNSSTTLSKKRRNIIISILAVITLGLISGMILMRNRITTENQAADVYTHEIVCKVSDVPEGGDCSVSVEESAEKTQRIDPLRTSQEYIFKIKAEATKSYECKVTCEGLAACIPTDSASCLGTEPSNSPSPSPEVSVSPSPTPTPPTNCLTPIPCDVESEIKKCPADYYCSSGGTCKHPVYCPEVTPSLSPSPTPSPSPTLHPSISPSPTPTVNPSASPTVTPRPSATPSPTPTTTACVPPAPVASVSLSCFTPGVCSWTAVGGADSYKVTIVDTTTGKKLAGFDPLKSTTATRVEYTPIDGHAYVCTVESVNVCGNAQSSSAYRDSQECREGSPSPTTTMTSKSSPSATPTPTLTKGSPTLPQGVTPSATPVPTLPVAGSIHISMWAIVGLAAIFFGLVVFR